MSSDKEEKRSMALQLIKKHQNQITSSFVLLPLLLWLTKTSWAYSYVKPGCQEYCESGLVRIPYPFGIGSNCYFNDWYSVECKNSSSRYASDFGVTPYLKRIDLEVLAISLYDSFIVVDYPVIKSSPNCPLINNNGSGSRSSVDLTNTPFHFSSYYNTFVAVGCNNHAVMTDLYGNKITECTLTPTCNNSTPQNNSRCKAEIPYQFQYLQAFNATFSGGASGEQLCTYAFLAATRYSSYDTYYYGSYPNLTEYSNDVQNSSTTHVPVYLEWIMQNSSDNGWVPSTGSGDNYSTCLPFSVAYSSPKRTRTVVKSFQCYCKYFSWGNPYLPDGCKVDCSDDPSLPGCNKSKIIISG